MNTVEKATFQDLIDGNAYVGPDGGIWYPSGPADVPVANIFTALVNEARSHRKTLTHCKFEFDRAERAEAEKNVLLMIAERFAPCPFVLFPDSDKRLYKDACATCQPKKELRFACLREFAAQEAKKAGA